MVFISLFGLYFLYKSGLYRPKSIFYALKSVFSAKKRKGGVSPFAAAATALGGTVGVGSIVGVAYGISVGGAGSIFWMWVCSFLGMGIKYAEVKIPFSERKEYKNGVFGGAPYKLKAKGKTFAAYLFCVFCLLASFFTGNITQIGSVSAFAVGLGINKALAAALCVAVVGLAVFGGTKRITGVNAFIVPLASVLYISLCFYILFVFKNNIFPAFSEIISQAFGLKAALGGTSAGMIMLTLREGFARSIFSGEAGMGSSPLAYSSAGCDDSEAIGNMGVFEIFFDTAVSTLTALCLISSGEKDIYFMFGEVFGASGGYILGFLISVFAFASVISWCCYGESCIVFMAKKPKMRLILYRVLFAAAAFIGMYIPNSAAIGLADIFNAFMMMPNLYMLFLCRNEITKKR